MSRPECLSLIVAMDANRLIGAGGKLPWHCPADLKRFKALTMGKPLIMGRKTAQSLGRPLPGRPCIVLTRDPVQADALAAQGFQIAPDWDAAWDRASELGAEVMVIGGAAIYAQALPVCDRIYLSIIHGTHTGDTYFPDFKRLADFVVVELACEIGVDGGHDFYVLDRVTAAPGAIPDDRVVCR